MNFITGNWEEKLDSNDFIRLNKFTEDVKSFENIEVFGDIKKFLKTVNSLSMNNRRVEDVFQLKKALETPEQRKLEESNAVVLLKDNVILEFVYADFSLLSIYGVKKLIKFRKTYLSMMEKQYQNVEWYNRKLKLQREIEELERFQAFCERQNLNVSKAATCGIDVLNYTYFAMVYVYAQTGNLPSSLYNVFEVLDIFLQDDIQRKNIDAYEANCIIKEFLENISLMVKNVIENNNYEFFITFNTDTAAKSLEIALQKMLEHKIHIPIQLILGEKPFKGQQIKVLEKMFDASYEISLSQTFRKKNTKGLDVTGYQNFFIKGLDNVFSLGSLDLEKVLIMSLNSGKDYETGTLVYKVTKSADVVKDTYEDVFSSFEAYLRYFINIYVEKINLNMFLLDRNDNNGFETALVDSFPHFLVNVAFHRINPLITILTAIKNKQFVVKYSEDGLIRKVSPYGNEKDIEVAEKIDTIIQSELKKMNLYKKAKHSVVYFAETPFYKKVDEYNLNDLPASVFQKSSLSGYVELTKMEFIILMSEFREKSYSHVRIRVKN